MVCLNTTWIEGAIQEILTLAIAAFFSVPVFAAFNDPFYTHGKLRVTADRDVIERGMPAEMRTAASDSATIVATNSEAMAAYSADIATLSVAVSARALNSGNPFNTDAFVGALFKDTLFFTVEAGHYPDGMFASLSGYFEGNIHMEGLITSGAQASWGVVFETLHGGSEHFFGHTDLLRPPQDVSIFEPFDLTIEVIHPGVTLPEPFMTGISVALALGGTDEFLSGPINRAQATGTLSEPALVTNDFSSTGQITRLVLPPGLDWNSASGVFPNELVVIPLPGAFWLFINGVGALVTLSRARLFLK